MKKVVLKNVSEVAEYIDALIDSANAAQMKIIEKSESRDGIQLLEEMKFEKLGYDPLDTERELNLIEQINQTFTYLASFRAVEMLFQWHGDASEFTLNLGTAAGVDIESKNSGGIAAEVFAATKPSGNDKINKDLKKVCATNAAHKYVFFMCPHIEVGEYVKKSTEEVFVWSLGV